MKSADEIQKLSSKGVDYQDSPKTTQNDINYHNSKGIIVSLQTTHMKLDF